MMTYVNQILSYVKEIFASWASKFVKPQISKQICNIYDDIVIDSGLV